MILVKLVIYNTQTRFVSFQIIQPVTLLGDTNIGQPRAQVQVQEADGAFHLQDYLEITSDWSKFIAPLLSTNQRAFCNTQPDVSMPGAGC